MIKEFLAKLIAMAPIPDAEEPYVFVTNLDPAKVKLLLEKFSPESRGKTVCVPEGRQYRLVTTCNKLANELLFDHNYRRIDTQAVERKLLDEHYRPNATVHFEGTLAFCF